MNMNKFPMNNGVSPVEYLICECMRFLCGSQVVGMAALACGMIAVGSCNGEVTSTILQTMMERSESDLKETYSKFLALGLALAYLGTSVLIFTKVLSVLGFCVQDYATICLFKWMTSLPVIPISLNIQ